MRIFCAEQIEVPETLPEILKNYAKAVIRNNPEDLVGFSRRYFEELKEERDRERKESQRQENTEEKMA